MRVTPPPLARAGAHHSFGTVPLTLSTRLTDRIQMQTRVARALEPADLRSGQSFQLALSVEGLARSESSNIAQRIVKHKNFEDLLSRADTLMFRDKAAAKFKAPEPAQPPADLIVPLTAP